MRFLVLNSDAERRDGLKTLLRQIDRHAGYNDAKDWRQAQRLIKQQSFDLIVVDWQDIKRLGDLHALCQACAPTPVAALVDDASPVHAQALFEAGVLGVISRTTRPHLIVRALEMVLLGGHYVPPSALNLTEPAARARDGRVEAIVSQLPRRKRSPCSLLSPRQAQIMRFVHMGSTNKMIARTLGISEGTVKIHLASIFQQLGATNRAAGRDLQRLAAAAPRSAALRTRDLAETRTRCGRPRAAAPGEIAASVPARRRKRIVCPAAHRG